MCWDARPRQCSRSSQWSSVVAVVQIVADDLVNRAGMEGAPYLPVISEPRAAVSAPIENGSARGLDLGEDLVAELFALAWLI